MEVISTILRLISSPTGPNYQPADGDPCVSRSRRNRTSATQVNWLLGWTTALLIVLEVGCSEPAAPPVTPPNSVNMSAYGYGEVSASQIQFKDDVTANATGDDNVLQELKFVGKDGQETRLRDLYAKQNVVLVMTRGYNGAICPYCSTQTARLIANYQKIKDRNAEVVVVYPLEKSDDIPRLDDFVKKVFEMDPKAAELKSIPFPILLDVDLVAVDGLGIRRDLSKPATYIIDSSGKLRFAYVGESLSDRPSVAAILKQLDAIKPASTSSTGSSRN